MKTTTSSMIGEIVRENYDSARIFEKHGIDFCCGGERSLEEACKKAGVEPATLLGEIEALGTERDRTRDFIETLPLPSLCDYIVQTHHSYVREQVPFIRQKLEKLCEVHGDHHPELKTVRDMFETASANLAEHMEKEETRLFPAVKELAGMDDKRASANDRTEQLLDIVQELKAEHQAEGDRFGEMAGITSGFLVPDDGCNTYRVAYSALSDFVDDLHRHVHLENNILFPETFRTYA